MVFQSGNNCLTSTSPVLHLKVNINCLPFLVASTSAEYYTSFNHYDYCQHYTSNNCSSDKNILKKSSPSPIEDLEDSKLSWVFISVLLSIACPIFFAICFKNFLSVPSSSPFSTAPISSSCWLGAILVFNKTMPLLNLLIKSSKKWRMSSPWCYRHLPDFWPWKYLVLSQELGYPPHHPSVL